MRFLQEIMTLRRIDAEIPADDEDHFYDSEHEHDHKCPCCADNSAFEDDFDDFEDFEDEETGLGMYDQQGNRSQGAPIDTDPENDEFERFCAQFTNLDFEEEEVEGSPYDEGYSARLNGRSRLQNPYSPKLTSEHNDWIQGWADANVFALEHGWEEEEEEEDILNTFRGEEDGDSMEDRAGAWHRGYNAAEHEVPYSSNPYPTGSILHLRWEQGWREAHEDMNREWDRSDGYEEEEDTELDLGDEVIDLDLDNEQSEDDLDLGLDQPEDAEGEDQDSGELDAIANKATEDPDKQGLIRKVKNAHLVYKRQTEDGTYEELWVYNTNNQLKDELDIRKAILAGTDIPVSGTESPDSSQTYEVWSSGNVEMLLVKGIQN